MEQTGIWESGIRHGPKGTQIGKVKGVSRRRSRRRTLRKTHNEPHIQSIYYLKNTASSIRSCGKPTTTVR